MKFRGKIDVLFWIVMLAGEFLLLGCLVFPEEGRLVIGIVFLVYNLMFLPFVFRNYVEVEGNRITLVFGFIKQTMDVSELTEVYRTCSPISSTAASLDRIVLRGNRKMMMCAVRDREAFLDLLERKNPEISISRNRKKGAGKLEKGTAVFLILVFAVVGVLLFTGNIRVEYGRDSFWIRASYWPDREIAYHEVEEVSYSDEKVDGTRVGGFGSFRLLMGSFRNSEFGNYSRYTYTRCDAGVVLTVNGRKVVLSGKDRQETLAIYEELCRRCAVE